MESRVRELRIARGMKQDDFANVFGISQQTVSRLEKNPESIPIDLLIQVARYFDVTTDYLLGLNNEQKNQSNTVIEKSHDLIVEFHELSDMNQRVVQYVIRSLKDIQE